MTKAVSDCGDEGCTECDVCTYLNFLEWVGQVAPRGESNVVERNLAIEKHLDLTYPGWRS